MCKVYSQEYERETVNVNSLFDTFVLLQCDRHPPPPPHPGMYVAVTVYVCSCGVKYVFNHAPKFPE